MEEQTENVAQEMTIREYCDRARATLGATGKIVKNLMNHPEFLAPPKVGEDRGEMKANIMLAYRHLEDARMRIGKVLQAQDGGTSVYDKPKVD